MTIFIVEYRVSETQTAEERIQAPDLATAQTLAERMFGKDNIVSIEAAE